MSLRISLKHNYPLLILALSFGVIIFFSFKHEPAPLPDLSALEPHSTAERDSVQFSAMHAEHTSPAQYPATSRDLAQARIVDEILIARNDNDPRLDTELRKLSPASKELIRNRYGSLLSEKRNERGTLVFLIGRDLSSTDDLRFMHQVITESPCRSLSDCSREDTGSVTPGERHWEGPSETTLAYPQIVALKSIESFLTGPARPVDLENQALATLDEAKHSPVRKVAVLAEEISQRLHRN